MPDEVNVRIHKALNIECGSRTSWKIIVVFIWCDSLHGKSREVISSRGWNRETWIKRRRFVNFNSDFLNYDKIKDFISQKNEDSAASIPWDQQLADKTSLKYDLVFISSHYTFLGKAITQFESKVSLVDNICLVQDAVHELDTTRGEVGMNKEKNSLRFEQKCWMLWYSFDLWYPVKMLLVDSWVSHVLLSKSPTSTMLQ